MRPIPPASADLARHLIRTGTPIDGGRRVRVNGTCRTIARDLGRSPGTIHEHLRHLDTAGVRVSCRPLILDAERLEAITNNDVGTPTATHSEPETAAEVDGGVVAQALATIERLAALEAEIGPDAAPAIERATAAVLEIVELAAARGDRAGRPEQRAGLEAARNPRGLDLSGEVIGRKESSSPTYPVPRERRAGRAIVARRTDADALELIEPLAAECRRLHLGAVTDTAGLTAALAAFTDDQVVEAVRRTVERVRRESKQTAGDRLRSPIGWLISAAWASEPALFSDPPDIGRIIAEMGDTEPVSAPGRPPAEFVAAQLGSARQAVRPG